MSDHYPQWSEHWSGWSYNQPDWQPSCDRCHTRGPARKFNAKPDEALAGRFAGRWLCARCVLPSDVPTPYQSLVDTERPDAAR